jgi:hypothetical protein
MKDGLATFAFVLLAWLALIIFSMETAWGSNIFTWTYDGTRHELHLGK